MNEGDDAKADVVVAALGLEPQTERGPAGPAVVAPAPSTPRARHVAGAIHLSRGLGREVAERFFP